jgi:large subunit ribosomal protein L31
MGSPCFPARPHVYDRPILISLRSFPWLSVARTAAMKNDIHPHYHMIKVVMTNGTEFMTRSTYGQEGSTLNLDIDPTTHPAWTGGTQQLLDRGGRLSRFNARFGSIGARK